VYFVIFEVLPCGVLGVPLDLFTVKGSSLLYEVKIVDFVKVENKESKLPWG